MDIQATLNLMIQAVVMGVVALMVFDFVGGLWVVPLPGAGWQPPIIEQSTVSVFQQVPTPQQEIPLPTPAIAPQFEEIPDPWTLETQSPQNCLPASAAIVLFPTLQLLPPAKAQEVQPTKPKRRTSKSTNPTLPKSPRQRQPKPRKITA
ncbi:hypothetical protein ACN23B_27400 (plasmid) [Anabaena sp. FACHB-709]|uniref:Uncharacterized protein n=3 Tax=Nostocaceae TaxID=1162 RepID=A0A1Z4KV01_ANAVA|nr:MULTISPECIES: hypothetical protein [Nostocaceae]BAY72723.1 hypothetical protein NIES23_55510 [Trichormus variabilis NIES-23]MBD2174944.1 hypothetical protein [Anabaena cylindrica FACHB-318]MBD2254811.1 hypothetical protein [Nostoc parmelioides FACHB-3921]MBD2266699.1 hypothetical protein [Anabaena sp. FACHB-709]MBD2276345.1 hypothetical protein [Nostoc sp. PCC 7120 = FACHB-418]